MELKNSSTTNPRVIQGGLKLDIDRPTLFLHIT